MTLCILQDEHMKRSRPFTFLTTSSPGEKLLILIKRIYLPGENPLMMMKSISIPGENPIEEE